MKKGIIFVLLLSIATLGYSQIQNPVTWSFSSKKIDAKTYEVHIVATVDDGWHLYSQTTPDGGPIPTSISFTKNPLITTNRPAKEIGKLEQRHEPLFGVDVKQFSGKVEFVQKVTLKTPVKTVLSGVVEFMVCNDTQCLPPAEKKFAIALQ